MATDEERLRSLENRLDAIERRLGPSRSDAPPRARPSDVPEASPSVAPWPFSEIPTTRVPPQRAERKSWRATAVMGWGGVSALVLATSYVIRLAVESGWLTPGRQVAIAALAGLALIAGGFLLRKKDNEYASLLPAGGVAVLFLSVYGAHLFHGLIGPLPATVAVIAICLWTLVLGEVFESNWYAIFAVIGSYSGPLLLSNLRADPLDLAIYFSAWNLLFCAYAIFAAERWVYLIAAYFSFIVFDLIWRVTGGVGWETVVVFQAVQVVIFAVGSVIYSIKNAAPMEKAEAWGHLSVLLLFYFVEYALLRENLPAQAPWLALASMIFILAAYGVARAFLPESPWGKMVVSIYASIVLLHAGYLELLPDAWRPWVALFVTGAVGATAVARLDRARELWPVFTAAGLIFFHNYGRLVFGWEIDTVVGYKALLPLYAAVIYTAYGLARQIPELKDHRTALLFFGHLNVMAGAVQLFDSRLTVSLVWGVLAVACLSLSVSAGDKTLGRSALFVFAGSAAKVLLFDLSNASPLIRIGCLVILGVTLYAGGLLYQRVDSTENISP